MNFPIGNPRLNTQLLRFLKVSSIKNSQLFTGTLFCLTSLTQLSNAGQFVVTSPTKHFLAEARCL